MHELWNNATPNYTDNRQTGLVHSNNLVESPKLLSSIDSELSPKELCLPGATYRGNVQQNRSPLKSPGLNNFVEAPQHPEHPDPVPSSKSIYN